MCLLPSFYPKIYLIVTDGTLFLSDNSAKRLDMNNGRDGGRGENIIKGRSSS